MAAVSPQSPGFYPNNLQTCVSSNKVCTAFGVKISTNAQVVQIAANTGFDSLFIDLEHSSLTLPEASNLCNVGHLAGITPFVRVPHQCGNGFVQRVLDGGAMGIIFPHVHNAADAKSAVSISKYPPMGCRSMTGQMPLFGMRSRSIEDTVAFGNRSGSTVIVMIESGDAVERADEIAAAEGVDVVMVGSSDLSIDLGVGGQFDHPKYREALERVSQACRKSGKVFGLGGVYDNPEVQEWAINTLGVRYLLVQQDISLITSGGAKARNAVPSVRD